MEHNVESAKFIINFFKQKGFTDIVIAGLVGNFHAESFLRSDNAQNSYMNKFGETDESYTKKVDEGTWKRPDTGAGFTADSIGYGLAQWTSSGRKAGLYDFIKSLGVSISNMAAQCEWAYREITRSKSLVEKLRQASSPETAAIIFMTDYERPASKDDPEKQQIRANYARFFYDEYLVNKEYQEKLVVEVNHTKSPLTDLTMLSPNHSGQRKDAVTRITPHCTAVSISARRIGEIFTPTSRNASCNYGIGNDLKVVCCVEEQNRSWCSSSADNDNKAITIECSSANVAPYKFDNGVFEKLVDLCIDICMRYGKTVLIWIFDKNAALNYKVKDNEMLLTVHRWFAAKACPGDWMMARMAELAERVTKALNQNVIVPEVSYIEYVVKSGDRLSRIAAAYNTTVDAIQAINPEIVDPNKIYIGQVIKISVDQAKAQRIAEIKAEIAALEKELAELEGSL